MEDEIRCLVPGGLYANCGVVRVKLPTSVSSASGSSSGNSGKEKKEKGVLGGGGTEEEDPRDVLGREVWEMMEREVKEWDEAEKQKTAESSS